MNTALLKHCIPGPDLLEKLVTCLFIVSVFSSAVLAFYGWSGQITDFYPFRQTQTAISSFYLARDGLTVDYVTPVLGPPWQIPFEFPMYQLIVAWLSNSFDIPLDQAGRGLSLSAFYLSLIPLYGILKHCGINHEKSLLALILYVTSPLYVFWSRTFMIETLALFFSLSCLYFSLYFMRRRTSGLLFLMLVFGCCASLTKVTTFVVTSAVFCFLLLALWLKDKNGFSLAIIGRYLVPFLFAVGIPLLVSVEWNSFADERKELNPLAGSLVSEELSAHNFGTLNQRFTMRSWDNLLMRSSSLFAYPWSVSVLEARLNGDSWETRRVVFFILSLVAFFFLFVAAVSSRVYRTYIVLCSVGVLVAPIIFIKLYFLHEYYWVANGVFLIGILSFGLLSLFDKWPLFALLLLSFVLAIRYDAYQLKYRSLIDRAENLNRWKVTDHIESSIKQDEVFVAFGEAWSSTLAYLSKRKAIMLNPRQIENFVDGFKRSLGVLGTDKVAMLVVCNKAEPNMSVISELLPHLDLSKPSYKDKWCVTYERPNSSGSFMLQLYLNSDIAPPKLKVMKGGRLFSHAPSSSLFTISEPVSSLEVNFGVKQKAVQKMKGVCFDLFLHAADSVVIRSEHNCLLKGGKARGKFVVNIENGFSGDVLLKNSCYEGECRWAHSFWGEIYAVSK